VPVSCYHEGETRLGSLLALRKAGRRSGWHRQRRRCEGSNHGLEGNMGLCGLYKELF
jgi:hypothetical protein